MGHYHAANEFEKFDFEMFDPDTVEILKCWSKNFDISSHNDVSDKVTENNNFGEIAQLYDAYEDALESICQLYSSEIPFTPVKVEEIAETILQKIYYDPTVEGKDFIAVKLN